MTISEYIRKMRQHIGQEQLILVGAAAVILNEAGQVLLQHRSDSKLWGIPGGSIEPGEEPAAAVMREVWEETGLRVLPERIVGVYGGPSHLVTYPNGDQCAFTSVTFACKVVGGELSVDDDESLELRWFDPQNLPEALVPHHRERIHHAVTRDTPFFRLPGGATG